VYYAFVINAHTITYSIIIIASFTASVISYAAIIINMISPLCGVSNFYEMTDLTPKVDLLTVRDEIDYRSL